jgi:hypothetical protein
LFFAGPVFGGQSAAGDCGTCDSLRLAVKDLSATFGDRYSGSGKYLSRLDAIDLELPLATGERKAALEKELADLRRESLAANPLLAGRPIVFVLHGQYSAPYHAIDTLAQVGEATEGNQAPGGALKSFDASGGKAATLVDAPKGWVRDPEISFDGKKIVFAMRRHMKENYHIYEVNSDGTGLRQLTRAAGVTDFDPTYLPDGGIVFSSTREPKYNMCSQDIGANLFRMDGDGANILQITKNTLFDNHSTILPDGRILYSRWEYVDRNFGDAHGIWSVNPDGTNQSVVYKNNTASPAAIYHAKPIGDTGKYVCILSTHHQNMWGAMAIIDPGQAVDGKAAVLRTWPAETIKSIHNNNEGGCDDLCSVQPKYEDPRPLYDPASGQWSDKYFLCIRMVLPTLPQHRAGELDGVMGIYLVDVFGNEVLLHAEEPGCFGPALLCARPRPPAIETRRNYSDQPGLLYVANVYQGTHMKGVKPGAVKKLRIVESPEKRGWCGGKWYGQGFMAPGMNWHDFTAKRILGTVPVESDGSAYFEVPCDTFVFFQLLDENDLMIQSMRSGTVLQSGEKTGCVGCHENRMAAPPEYVKSMPTALGRAPSRITPWYGKPRIFSYAGEVQPVLDKNCVRCHDFGTPAGVVERKPRIDSDKAARPDPRQASDCVDKLILAGDRDPFFNASYTQLWRKGYIRAIGAGPAGIQAAYSWGAQASKIVQMIRAGHHDVKLDKESFDRLATWIDINAPYYPTYYSAYPDNIAGRCPIDNNQLTRLGKLTGIEFFNAQCVFCMSTGPQVSFDRPELSPCLAKLAKNGPEYKEALAIIQAGKDSLGRQPRGDVLEGFVPCPKDQQREAVYLQRRQIELRNRQAIGGQTKLYDDSTPEAYKTQTALPVPIK